MFLVETGHGSVLGCQVSSVMDDLPETKSQMVWEVSVVDGRNGSRVSGSKRKTFVAREDLLSHLSAVASRKGFSLYDTVNDILEQALSIDGLGLALKDMVNECEEVESAKKAGFVLCPERLWYDLTELSFKKSREASIETWYEAGKWLGKRYVETIPKDPLSKFKKDLHAFLWNAVELNIREEKKNLSIGIISPKFSETYSRLLAFLLQGALEVLGYRPVNSEVGRGNIQIVATRAESNAEA